MLAKSSLKIKENIIQLLGETEFHLRGRSFSQEHVGDVLIKLNLKEEALNLYEQALDTYKMIIERYGENADRLENLLSVNSKLGTHSDEGSKKQRDYFEQALILNERRLLTYPQYAKQSVSDHELMLKEYRDVAEKSGDAQYLQACAEFEERLSRYKSEHNL